MGCVFEDVDALDCNVEEGGVEGVLLVIECIGTDDVVDTDWLELDLAVMVGV